MAELLTSAQMRAIEAAAIASGAVTGLDLMERAGQAVVEAVFEQWPELAQGEGPGALPRTPEYFSQDEGPDPRKALVLCGPGNNGGDGFVVARVLHAAGWQVEVILWGDAGRLPPDAALNCRRWREIGGVRECAGDLPAAWGFDLVVDALFGTGLSRPLEVNLGAVLPEADLRGADGVARVVSIDVPSGLCADSGRILGARAVAVYADLTVTFHRAKTGHVTGDGPEQCGRLVVKDIGIPVPAAVPAGAGWILWPAGSVPPGSDPPCDLATGVSGLAKRRDLHKYGHGHALVLSGPAGRGGAARLAARGALRTGAGVVTVGCPPDAIPEHAARLDAVMLRGVADAAALAGLLEDGRINALCMGPGMGVSEETGALLARGLRSGRRMVLDADALTLLSQDGALSGSLHGACVLTPHGGEFARLFPDIALRLAEPATKGPAFSRVDATREAAARAGCVVLFKGPDTVIAEPNGRAAVNAAVYDRAAPWLATAGSGDVLAGFITGLLARGFAPFDAACAGAWLHVEAARSFGPGLIAEDLPEELPKVFRALGL
jgi:ADP-dependent NAD(P)H-hydrate dehydratase / NAD(P)H-hydrate epimerase